ncbi:MAG: endonuclease/exonuclease/phosphatase family protein [Planctomycetes bacterium]|nr:endonuclease/exonuclease/phosphatase family protein [Planctomycetota bacterium]
MNRQRLRLIAILAGAPPAAGLALAALAPTGWFVAQLASHWAPHLAVLALPLWCAAGRRTVVGAACLALYAAALWPHLAAAHTGTAPPPRSPAHTAVSANLYIACPDHAPALAVVTASEPDLLLLIETRAEDRAAMRDDPRWPHQSWQTPRTVGGIGLLSRWPMRAKAVALAGATAIDARIDTPDGALRVIGLHTWSPVGSTRNATNAAQLLELAGLVETEPGPLLVLGDLNATPSTPGLRRLHAAGLHPPSGGEVRTWPSWLGPAGIAIDHVLARHLALGGAEAIDLPGSDHHAIRAGFSLIGK